MRLVLGDNFNMTDKVTLSFVTANNTVTHLGRKLYSSAPPAIAELIANSYDAYATKCYVQLEKENNSNESLIVVADNGIGMDIQDLQDRYENIGQQKKEIEVPENMTSRKPMGKKGIGKLAAFSLGDSYTVYTKTDNSPSWYSFTLDYQAMIDDKNSQHYDVGVNAINQLPSELSEFASFEHGMIVVINKLRRSIIRKTFTSLKEQLMRRFFLRGKDFALKINGDDVNLADRSVLYDKIEALTYIGYTKDNISSLFGEERLNEKSTHPLTVDSLNIPSQDSLYDNVVDMVKNNHIQGWIGVIDKPKSLQKIGLGGVVIYINGKVADEDFLKDYKDARMGGSYICGELHADYLNESSEEPITSSRQGLDASNREVGKLIEIARSMQNSAIDQWNKLRETHATDSLPPIIKDNEEYRNWQKGLTTSQRNLNNRLLKILSTKKDFDDSDELDTNHLISLVNSFTQIVEVSELPELGKRLCRNDGALNTDADFLDIIARYMATVATSEKLSQASLVEKRLGAIHTLEKLMANSSVKEKAFQEHLFANPWLINPFWNQTTRSDDEIKIQREVFVKLYNEQGDNYKRQFIDIYLEVADEPFPIVVELKKNNPTGHANVKWSDIIDQIDRYRKALLQKLTITEMEELNLTADSYQKIQGYFIISEDTGTLGQGNTITLDRNQQERIADSNIKLLSYSDLVRNAKSAYREFSKDLKEHKSNVPYIPLEA